MVRVLYLTINPNRVSTTVPTEGWIRILRSQGLKPVLVSHEIGAFHEWAVGEQVPAYHVTLHQPSKRNPFPFFMSLWRLFQIVRKHQIQLIHCNEQNCYPIGSYLARLCRLPVLVSVHFTMQRDFCSWAFGKHCPDRIFFVSSGNQENCRAGVEGIIPTSRWRVLNNAIDTSRYLPDPVLRSKFRIEHGLGDRAAIGVACALRERKQVEHLFAAAANLPESVAVLLAGGPVADERDYASDLIALGRKQLGSRLIYMGHLEDLRPFCNALDLFVNTSREEAFGIGVLEAMACGCPVVGYPSRAVDCVVLPDGGEITPQDDILSLTNTIIDWLEHPQRIECYRKSARNRAVAEFDTQKNCSTLWREYHAVINGQASLDSIRATHGH